MLSINFILGFVGMAVVLLFAILLFNEVSQIEIKDQCGANCNVNFDDPISNQQDNELIYLVLFPVLLIPLLFVASSFREDGDPLGLFKQMFGGLGGSVVQVEWTREDLKDKGWKGADDFEV